MAAANAQVTFGNMQNQISRGKDGINVFDVQKDDKEFKGLSVEVGGAFAMQFQAFNSFNDQASSGTVGGKAYSGYRLTNLENQFNLPAANMVIGAQLADGVRVNLDLYLAARHHNETWVKGGYLQIDKLDFIKKDFLADVMKYTTIKIGQMENNYGDAHFRRTDNGQALLNPFIEGNIMDSFQTDMGMEVYYNRNGWVSMLGVTNGKLNQSVQETDPNVSPTILAKFGYDKQLNKDLRVRLTGSYNHNANMSSNPWSSDRGGSRYYGVMAHNAYTFGGQPVAGNALVAGTQGESTFTTGRYQPGYSQYYTAFMFNPFVKYKGLEFFGTIETTTGGASKTDRSQSKSVNQFVGDVVYRFGQTEQFYLGARYGTVTGELETKDVNASINRLETSAGWFMTKNILAKLAYVDQTYKDFSQVSAGVLNDNYGGQFKGLMFEAVIAF
ncbi:hypothetical protein FEM08_16500 [Flavobacterium gilvum]|nr:hypothetical protein FEM08_16500 [Flavobacterium gilvum]